MGLVAGAAADRVRLRRPPADTSSAGRLPQAGRQLLPGARALVHQRVELRFDRDRVWIAHRGETVARYVRSYDRGRWFPPPRPRPEPPPAAAVVALRSPMVAPPELTDYAELCA
jgi:hypothetical protein